jgi:hypothetical protein
VGSGDVVASGGVEVGRRCPSPADRSELALGGELALGTEAVALPVPLEAFARAVVPDFAEWLLPVASAFESDVLWLDDAESVEESALATAVPLASDAANPTATAPVPSHVDTSLCCGWAR